jgi:hypothetical protein
MWTNLHYPDNNLVIRPASSTSSYLNVAPTLLCHPGEMCNCPPMRSLFARVTPGRGLSPITFARALSLALSRARQPGRSSG